MFIRTQSNSNKQGRERRQAYIDACPTNSGDATSQYKHHVPTGEGQYIKEGMCGARSELTESQAFKAAERFGKCVAFREQFRENVVTPPTLVMMHILRMKKSRDQCNAQGRR